MRGDRSRGSVARWAGEPFGKNHLCSIEPVDQHRAVLTHFSAVSSDSVRRGRSELPRPDGRPPLRWNVSVLLGCKASSSERIAIKPDPRIPSFCTYQTLRYSPLRPDIPVQESENAIRQEHNDLVRDLLDVWLAMTRPHFQTSAFRHGIEQAK